MGAQISPRFDMRSRAGAQTKAIDPVQRFRWALSFPGIAPAAGKVLAALADHADQRKLTCFPSVETLARETQVSERGVRYALRKLETAGAILTERSSGRSSSLYRLMIPTTRQGLPRSTLQSLPPNPARIAPLNPARFAPLTELSLEQSKREQGEQQQERAREASGEASDEAPTSPAAAAPPIDSSSTTEKRNTGRHTCPKCERTWPHKYGPVCFDCDTYRRRKTEHRQDNNRRVLGLNWPDADLPAKIIDLHPKSDESSSFQALIEAPPPTADRKALADKLQADRKAETAKEHKRQAELPSIEDSLKVMKDALFRTG